MLDLIQQKEWKLAYALAYHFAFIDLALGFVLCILSGARFRAAARYYVLELFCGWRSKWKEKIQVAEVGQPIERRETYKSCAVDGGRRQTKIATDGEA